MKQVNIALPDATRSYLEEIAEKNSRKLSEEVRARLDRSLVEDQFDATTKDLGFDVMMLARMLRSDPHRFNGQAVPEARWDLNEDLFASLKVAVDAWLNDLRNQLKLKPAPQGYEPQAVSRGEGIARAYANLKPMLIRNRPGGDNMEE